MREKQTKKYRYPSSLIYDRHLYILKEQRKSYCKYIWQFSVDFLPLLPFI